MLAGRFRVPAPLALHVVLLHVQAAVCSDGGAGEGCLPQPFGGLIVVVRMAGGAAHGVTGGVCLISVQLLGPGRDVELGSGCSAALDAAGRARSGGEPLRGLLELAALLDDRVGARQRCAHCH